MVRKPLRLDVDQLVLRLQQTVQDAALAEARLARHLAAGCTVARAAPALGIAVSTARRHLKALMAKSRTHRQADLVAVLGLVSRAG